MKKWRPSKTQRREFAEKMQNPEFSKAYYDRKFAKEEKRRSTSNFDYYKAGGNYVPTKLQHDFCLNHSEIFITEEQLNAKNLILQGYSCNEMVHHDYIHIINELIRNHD